MHKQINKLDSMEQIMSINTKDDGSIEVTVSNKVTKHDTKTDKTTDILTYICSIPITYLSENILLDLLEMASYYIDAGDIDKLEGFLLLSDSFAGYEPQQDKHKTFDILFRKGVKFLNTHTFFKGHQECTRAAEKEYFDLLEQIAKYILTDMHIMA